MVKEEKMSSTEDQKDSLAVQSIPEDTETVSEVRQQSDQVDSAAEPDDHTETKTDQDKGQNLGMLKNGSDEEIDTFAEDFRTEESNETVAEDDVAEDEKEEESGQEHESSNEESEEEEQINYSHATKDELIQALKSFRTESDIRLVDKHLKEIKPAFDEQYEFAKNEALQAFISAGNEAEGFHFQGEEIDRTFFQLYNELKSKRNRHFKEIENEREQNLKKKESLLDRLREIVDGQESAKSIDAVREIQSEWKKVGGVAGATMNKTLWANYNALLDRYYDNRGIYFELKDLDRKKNKTLKEALCEKAEALVNVEELKVAVLELNELHNEYKHIGPVPKDDQEPLWQRFKAASDKIYDKRNEFYDALKEEFAANYEVKQSLVKDVEALLKFDSDRISEWNEKTKEILAIQKRWEATGGVPRDKIRATNKSFWAAFKGFFNKKSSFFKTLESKHEENLQKKNALIQQAEELKDNEDFASTAQKLKLLQNEWKDIGPIPDKVRNETYKRFKKACDHFFDRKRADNKEVFKEQEDNLKLKLSICDELQAIGKAKEVEVEVIYKLLDQFYETGFVPRKAIKKCGKRFEDATKAVLSNQEIDEYDREVIKEHLASARYSRKGGRRDGGGQESSMRRKISLLENDVTTWKTNIEFFASSSKADELKRGLEKKIEQAIKEIDRLKNNL